MDYWFLLTYPGPLGERALEGSDLPPAVKAHLEELIEQVPNARILLMGDPRGGPSERLNCFWVDAREAEATYSRLALDHYEQIMDLDWATMAGGEPPAEAVVGRKPFYLVCTNGKRDPCCAQYGIPVLNALRDLTPASVRGCSHVGGHRFAANVLVFPYAIYYGRVRPGQCAALIEATDRGQILMGNYRGRSCYEPAVQAAESALRRMTGRAELGAIQLVFSRQIEADAWRIRFHDAVSGVARELRVNLRRSRQHDYVSCNSEKRAPVLTYDVHLRRRG